MSATMPSPPPAPGAPETTEVRPTGGGMFPPPTRLERAPRRQTGAIILIALGLFFLLANVVALGGGAFLIGLGLAFLVARATTGRYGFSVPAGVLLGLGSFAALIEAGIIPNDGGPTTGGWAMIMLGLGFLGAYVIGWRPAHYWPTFPAAVLCAMGLVMIDGWAFAPLAPFAWLATYWPIMLVVVGLWLLARPLVPPPARGAVGVLMAILFVLYGTIAVASLFAGAFDPAAWSRGNIRFGNPGVFPWSAPIGPATTPLTVTTSSGNVRSEGMR